MLSVSKATAAGSDHSLQAVAAPPAMTMDEAAVTYGFEKIKTEFITEYNSEATLFRHVKTGAEVKSTPLSVATCRTIEDYQLSMSTSQSAMYSPMGSSV